MSYKDMTLDELQTAKRALQEKVAAMRATMHKLPEGEEGSEERRKLAVSIKEVRAEMLEIQAEQDRKAMPLPEPDHVIGGAGNIVSQEAIGEISKPARKPRKK